MVYNENNKIKDIPYFKTVTDKVQKVENGNIENYVVI
jgi:hypothetical protein